MALRGVALAAVVALTGCDTNPAPSSSTVPGQPTPTSAAEASGPPSPSSSPGPEPSPSASIGIPATFPLAVVTGLRTRTANIAVDELQALARAGNLVVPCGIEVTAPSLELTGDCTPADLIPGAIEDDNDLVALLPPGLVQPATKVLAIEGDGPLGLFGPDLFGGPEARAMPYPIEARVTDTTGLDPAWLQYDATQIWTLHETGSLCADRGGARQAVTLGKGWDWIFNGGTARYKGPPFPNPNPPPGIDRHPIVQPVETGNEGVTAKLISSSDVTLGNLKCPVLPTDDWAPSNQAGGLSVPEAVLVRWEEFLGIDAVYLPADHQSDRGVRGIRSTLQLVAKHGFPHTGLGMDLDEALEPAYVEIAGQKVAFVAWNNVPGPTHADADTPGVAWLTKANVDAAVGRAKAAGADVIVCDPQWWAAGDTEYEPTLTSTQARAVGWMDNAGCDQILAGGLHVSGGLRLKAIDGDVRVINTGPGNFQYGQDFWQDTMEGVVVELVF